MNEENMDLELEGVWGDEGGEGAAEPALPEEEIEAAAPPETPAETPAQPAAPPAPPEASGVPQGAPVHPLLERARQNARRQDMERFLQAYPEVQAQAIPREVWSQVAQGVPLLSAYAMHENKRLKMELAAERQNRANRRKTPGALGANSGTEMDEIDRMWAEDD